MYLGLDLGTSGVKALLIDASQAIVASASGALDVSRPHPGWSEQDPADWIRATEEAVGQLKRSHGTALAAVRGIGLSGQMHGATLIDAQDKVLRPCILWNDTRSHAEAAQLDANPDFRPLTGNIVFPGFTAPKLLWVKNNEPGIFDQVHKVLLPKDYLRLWLTGEYISEMSDSAGTVLARRGEARLVVQSARGDFPRRAAHARARRRHASRAARCAPSSPTNGAWAQASSSRAAPATMRPRPAAWARSRRAPPSCRSARRACCLPPTPPICPIPTAPCTPSAMRCPTPGTRWA